MERIHPQIIRINVTVANQYLLNDHNKLILIDTGLSNNTAKILKTFNSLGLYIVDLHQIWINHSNGDHYGSVNALVRLSKAITFASFIETEAMREGMYTRPLKQNGVLKYLLRSFPYSLNLYRQMWMKFLRRVRYSLYLMESGFLTRKNTLLVTFPSSSLQMEYYFPEIRYELMEIKPILPQAQTPGISISPDSYTNIKCLLSPIW